MQRPGIRQEIRFLHPLLKSCASESSVVDEVSNRTRNVGKMRKSDREKCTMSSVEFCQMVARERIAPPSIGSVKVRIAYYARKLKLTQTRARDIWYANPRVSIKVEELQTHEDYAGVRYGREEARELTRLIERADSLLAAAETDSNRTLVNALIAFVRALDRPRIEG